MPLHWTSRDKEGEWRKDADDDTNAKERLPCPCHHATRQSPCHCSPMGEPPRRERGAAAAQVARTPCIMFHALFTSPQAVHVTLCRLFYALLVRLLVFHNQVVINVSFYEAELKFIKYTWQNASTKGQRHVAEFSARPENADAA